MKMIYLALKRYFYFTACLFVISSMLIVLGKYRMANNLMSGVTEFTYIAANFCFKRRSL